MHFFEIPKLPQTVEADNILELWLSLFKAETEEDLARLEKLEVQEMSEAITAYRNITVTPEFQEAERLRSKARHDEAQALFGARRDEKLDIAKNLFAMEMTVDQIVTATGLPRAEVESLRN